MTMGDKIAAARKKVNLTQEELAYILNVSRQSVSRWESGLAYPEMDKVVKLCNELAINCDYLLRDDVDECGVKVIERVIEKTVYINSQPPAVPDAEAETASPDVIPAITDAPSDLAQKRLSRMREFCGRHKRGARFCGITAIIIGVLFSGFGFGSLCFVTTGGSMAVLVNLLFLPLGALLIAAGAFCVKPGAHHTDKLSLFANIKDYFARNKRKQKAFGKFGLLSGALLLAMGITLMVSFYDILVAVVGCCWLLIFTGAALMITAVLMLKASAKPRGETPHTSEI